MGGSRLYRVRDLQDRYGVVARTIYRWIARYKLDAIKISGRIRIPEEALTRFEKNAREQKDGCWHEFGASIPLGQPILGYVGLAPCRWGGVTNG